MSKIKRPALKYYCGKWRLAPWVISHFPPHTHYIEPCFGGGNILLRKPPAPLETVNDLNGRLINFFKVLRDQPSKLIELIDLTPWAQEEYEQSKTGHDNSLEDARQFFVMSWMSVNGAPLPTGFRVTKTRAGRGTIPPRDIINHSLRQVAERIKTIQILCMGAVQFIDKFSDDPDSLIYFDPPYPQSTRTGAFYGLWDGFDALHAPAAALLRSSRAHVLVSGYRCNEYHELYEKYGWIRLDKEHRAQANRKRIESLWIAPRTYAALKDMAIEAGIVDATCKEGYTR